MSEKKAKLTRASGSQKYQEVAKRIAEEMALGKWKARMRMPSVRQLATDHGVSKFTIQTALQVLKKQGLVHIRPRSGVEVGAGVSFDAIFKTSLAIVTSDDLHHAFSAQYLLNMLKGIASTLRATGCTYVVLQDHRWRKEFPAGLRMLPVQGVLLMGSFNRELQGEYANLSVPVVLLDEAAQDLRIHSISVAGYEASIDAVRRLVMLGHQRIAFIRPVLLGADRQRIDLDAKERSDGFRVGCQQAGLAPRNYRVYTSSYRQPAAVVQEVLSVRPPYTAVVFSSGTFRKVLMKTPGLSVPRDLSVAEFAPTTLFARVSGPRTDFFELGAQAARLVLNPPEQVQRIRIPCVWYEGNTMGTPRTI
ncbi:MAG: GntR family transcriptional regulator [Planctomycetes bacterium]|nr:GntR family transcriptional regulator [Planctomycetota bacterium]